jgi:hypothetical protein
LNSYWDNDEGNYKRMRVVIHLLITEGTLIRGGVCSSCNVNTCT